MAASVATTTTTATLPAQHNTLASATSTTTLDMAMASRRVPLASVPHAVNSPIRAGVIGKRTRTQAGDTNDLLHSQPPTKKQIVEVNEENIDPRATHGTLSHVDDQFPKRAPNSQPTVLERKLAASRNRGKVQTQHKQQSVERQAKATADNSESVRQWQRHYRRQFPAFVFYFDGVADDVRTRCSRYIRALGAREEKFFSKVVTHVVTTRDLPPDVPSNNTVLSHNHPQNDTAAANYDARKLTNMLDATMQKRAAIPQSLDVETTRRVAMQAADILTRARELKIKIWALEKLQRVLKAMFETDPSDVGLTLDIRQSATLDVAIAHPGARQSTKPVKDADLEQLLRIERINGPERDTTTSADTVFKGCYIYVHDMNESTRPVMVRDYPKPAHKTEGKWPQFHMTAQGRCPFVEDQSYIKQQQQQKQQPGASKQDAQALHDSIQQRRTTRATTVTDDKQPQQPLAERNANLRRSPRKLTSAAPLDSTKPLGPPKLIPIDRQAPQEEVPLFANVQTSSRAVPRMIGGMPVASGLQQSNVTSAIRSQIVSSTAISSTAPSMSRRLTDSKEITALKRKVLERGASAHSQPPSSHNINDMRAAINDESAAPPPPRAAKRKAQESILGVVNEGDECNAGAKSKRSIVKKRKAEKDPKPGYCENCRDKFDDFEEHIASRKHQKFARAPDNFKELDALLAQLRRPHKVR